MDPLFLALLVVFTLVLLSACVLNRVSSQTDDLLKVFNALKRQNPTAVAYSLGYDRRRNLYRNVYTRPGASDGGPEAFVSWEPDPVTLDGNYVVNSDHGAVVDLQNGFRVSGMNDDVPFKCPDGYEGARCLPRPLCTPEESAEEKTKPLTYSHFNALNLYKKSFTHASADLASGERDAVAAHPRIRVQCLTGGSYELQVCPDNKLIEPSTAQCREYDVCHDHVNGYKHDFQIGGSSSDALQKGEYYLCVANKSERKRCREPDAVFDITDQGCKVRSVCWDRGKSQLFVDDNHYIQCRGDTGQKVFCEHGLQTHGTDGTISCVTKTCKAYTLRFSDTILNYVYGENRCDSMDRPTLDLCDNTPTTKRFDFSWAEKFGFTIANWPTTVLDEATRSCVEPTLAIVEDTATVDLAWSAAMHDAHKFNIRKKEYVCDTKYRWNYLGQTLVPPAPEEMFVDSAAPCQAEAVALDETDWWSLANSYFGKGVVDTYPLGVTPPLVYVVPFSKHPPTGHHFWPVYDVAKKKYLGSVCRYDSETDKTTIYNYKSKSHPPCGFAEIHEVDVGDTRRDIPLTLIGYEGFPTKEINRFQECMYYIIASGKTEAVKFLSKAKPTTHVWTH